LSKALKIFELVKNARKAMEASDAEEAERAADITARIGSNSYQVPDEDVVSNILGGIPSHI
jgi:hypothetical protein